jgi:multidrug efflux pump subunit AcrA (membrane-fusion protein)
LLFIDFIDIFSGELLGVITMTQFSTSYLRMPSAIVAVILAVFGQHDVFAQAQTQTVASGKSAQKSAISSIAVRVANSDSNLNVDGVVEAVRNTVISAQIAGAILQLPVQAGDVVKAGQLLVRMDARAAQQEFNASKAQVDAAKANLAVAEKDYERQKLLFEKNYISQAQLDRALAQFKSASAQANSQIAQAGAVQTQSGFYTINAPYNGIVSEMPSAVGEMVFLPLFRSGRESIKS